MSTRASISAKLSDGRWASIYCHWDGYPEHTGMILHQYYSTQIAIDGLFKKGSLSFLGETPEQSEYYVDMGEVIEISYADTLDDVLKQQLHGDEAYYYSFQKGKWYVTQNLDDEPVLVVDWGEP